MKYILLIILTICSATVSADTVVTDGALFANTTFLKSKSPYVFNQNLTVQPNVILTIEKGVTLVFNQGGLFVNKGTLVGNGFTVESKAPNFSFLVQCNNCNLNLNFVAVIGVPRSFISAWNNSTVLLDNIDVNFSSTSPNITGIQVFNNTSLTVSNSSFTRLAKAMDIFSFSTTSITNSFFTYNDHAIYTFDSSVDLQENDFEYNHIAIEFFANLDVLPIVDAHNNWWGQASFPPIYRDEIAQVKQSDINAIVGVVIYDPWNKEPHKKKQIVEGISNVLFLPGLMGSRLYKKETFENQLWEPNRNKDVSRLFLNSSGKSIEQSVYTRDIISKTNIVGGVTSLEQSPYKDFQTYLNGLVQSKTINSWKSAPYDWRYSPDTIVRDGIVVGDGKYTIITSLVAEVVSLAKNSKTKKITIITHSNGGLVAKQLMIELQKQKLDSLVEKIISVAMPEYGTPQAITSLLYGHEQSIAGGLILRATIAQKLGINMPSAYSLIPTEKYFTTGNSLTIKDTVIHQKTELNTIISTMGNINQTLLAQADTLHLAVDNWNPPPTIPMYQIVGTGVLTVSGIGKNSKGKPLPEYSSTGDGTVQDMYNQTTREFTRTGKVFIADLHNTKFNHTTIMNAGEVMKYIDLLVRKIPEEAALIPFGAYPSYFDTFTLLSLSTPTQIELSQKNIQITTVLGKDILNHDLQTQFDFTSSKSSEGRFDLFDKNIQYISYTPIEKIEIHNSKNDTFDIGVYTKSLEGIQEIQYEDIVLFQDTVLSLDFNSDNSQVDITLPLLNQHVYSSPVSQNTATSSIIDIVTKVTQVKSAIQISNITQYIKSRYIRRLDTIAESKSEAALASLKGSIEEGIKAIDAFSHTQMLKNRYAKLKQDYIYIVYLLR